MLLQLDVDADSRDLIDTLAESDHGDTVAGPLWRFVRAIHASSEEDWAEQVECMRQDFASVVGRIGVRYFGYHLVRCPSLGTPTGPLTCMVSTYPEDWTRRYAAEGYDRDDPVLAEALRSPEPFVWSQVADSERLGQRHRQFFADARAVGIEECLTLPVHVQTEVAALSVVPHAHGRARVLQQSHLFYLMAHYYHLRVRRPLIEVAMTTSARRRSLLSPRETQVLELTARGKSTSEISWTLGIAHKSVEFHIEGARRKLNVSNRTHAVAKALMLGLLEVD